MWIVAEEVWSVSCSGCGEEVQEEAINMQYNGQARSGNLQQFKRANNKVEYGSQAYSGSRVGDLYLNK